MSWWGATLAESDHRTDRSPSSGDLPRAAAGHDGRMSGPPPDSSGTALQATRSQRWLARLSFVLAFLAVAVVVAFAGLKSVEMLGVGLAAAAVSLATAFLVLSRRGVLRWLALVVFVLAPITVIVVYAFAGLLWLAAVSAAGWLLAGLTARAALAGNTLDWRMPELPAAPARHPFLIMNPRSGGGKVAKFDLRRKAEALGAEVFLISGPEPVDVAEVARRAVAAGSDLLGVAGGDGTQALVAGVAAEHGIPFVVITAGAAGATGVQQPLRDGRYRGPEPARAAGSRCARRGRRNGGQRGAGGRPAPRQAHHRPARADRADRRDYRQLGTDPGRHRRRGRLPAGTRALRDPSRRAAGPGATGPSRRASAQGHHQLVPPAAPGVVAAPAAVGRRARGPLAGHRRPSGQIRAGTGCGPLTSS
jgi:hypothetical protein